MIDTEVAFACEELAYIGIGSPPQSAASQRTSAIAHSPMTFWNIDISISAISSQLKFSLLPSAAQNFQ
ncbi:hypothetical protein LP420_12770 [Massilia sp. B-10]|nr:hypothetical protein LP420_12770 [Massilia sp. B-10]